MDNSIRFDEAAVCDTCGRFGAYVMGETQLCLDCYESRGSCCSSEFDREQPPKCTGVSVVAPSQTEADAR